MTYSAECLRDSIKYHSHYGQCLKEYRYDSFRDRSNTLEKCINYYTEANRLKEQIIQENNNLKIKEKEANKSREIADREYELIKENFREEEEREIKYNQDQLIILEEKKKNEITDAKNKIESLEKEIENLKKIIEELRNKNVEEEEWKKEEIINNLQHEYELKLDRYKRVKEYEKLEKEEKIKVMEKKNNLLKEAEFAELRMQSDFVEKLISVINIKNFNINNSLIQIPA